ncbi:MAG: uncharacterized protein KVP18_001970 [Porospora cf. gigantea A]|uniref:uncharacterized protein n=1 Tax=Porospora cf. gigantea A TaxID=2853593 RepID=UPI003559B350|nr:MAG: hypothetical protein KVP18_001970 [Porospora cf. gigantea A]
MEPKVTIHPYGSTETTNSSSEEFEVAALVKGQAEGISRQRLVYLPKSDVASYIWKNLYGGLSLMSGSEVQNANPLGIFAKEFVLRLQPDDPKTLQIIGASGETICEVMIAVDACTGNLMSGSMPPVPELFGVYIKGLMVNRRGGVVLLSILLDHEEQVSDARCV